MRSPRTLFLARWLLSVLLLILYLVPAGLVQWRSIPFCQCGMSQGHCSCALSHHAKAGGGHPPCGMSGEMPEHCSLRSSQPMESRTAPLGPDFHDPLVVFRHGILKVRPELSGTLASLGLLPPAAPPAALETPPPRASFRIG